MCAGKDVDYKNVIEYADELTKKVYEKQIILLIGGSAFGFGHV